MVSLLLILGIDSGIKPLCPGVSILWTVAVQPYLLQSLFIKSIIAYTAGLNMFA